MKEAHPRELPAMGEKVPGEKVVKGEPLGAGEGVSQKMSASLILRNFLWGEVEREQGNRSTPPSMSG